MSKVFYALFALVFVAGVACFVTIAVGSHQWSEHCLAMGGSPQFFGKGGGICIRNGLIIDWTHI